MKKVIPADSILVPAEADRVYNGVVFDIYQWQQHLFDGTLDTFEMAKRSDTTSAICIVDNKVLVLDDEQPHIGSIKTFPGGRIDKEDENTQSAIRRELTEETGYSFNNYRLIKVVQPMRSVEWFAYVYLAWDVSGKREPSLDAGEKINVNILELKDVKTLVENQVGYLGSYWDVFEKVNTIDDLLSLPEFEGLNIDR